MGMVALGLPVWAGALVMAAAMLGGQVLRLILPEDRAGPLAVRSRNVDVLIYAVLGVMLAVAALSLVLLP